MKNGNNSLILMSLILSVLYVGKSQEIIKSSFNSQLKGKGYQLFYDHDDPAHKQISNYVQKGLISISTFFDKPFKNDVMVFLFKTRLKLDQQWQKDWNMPEFKSQCWMVGSGIESRLDLLSPTAWESEACEHDSSDQTAIKKLVYHELTHILHSDYNKSPKFDITNNIDWFVEGLATYASDQLDYDRFNRAKQYVKKTNEPKQLANFWKGEHKYGLAGSIVKYIDETFGREILSELLYFNDVNDILNRLNLSENNLIEQWKKSL